MSHKSGKQQTQTQQPQPTRPTRTPDVSVTEMVGLAGEFAPALQTGQLPPRNNNQALRQTAILHLQRQHGNNHVQRLLAGQAHRNGKAINGHGNTAEPADGDSPDGFGIGPFVRLPVAPPPPANGKNGFAPRTLIQRSDDKPTEEEKAAALAKAKAAESQAGQKKAEGQKEVAKSKTEQAQEKEKGQAAKEEATQTKTAVKEKPGGKLEAKQPSEKGKGPAKEKPAGGEAAIGQPGGAVAQAPGENGAGPQEKAPASSDEDPSYQQVIQSIKGVAAGKKAHEPAKAKANAAQDAAEAPASEIAGRAQNNQVSEMVQAEAPTFDKAAFKAKLMERIQALSPKTAKEADEFKSGDKLGGLKNEMKGKVDAEKEKSRTPTKEKTAQAPDTGAIPPKPVNPLQPATPGSVPPDVGAQYAVPKAKTANEVEKPLANEARQVDQQMAEEDISESQLKKSNEPEFQSALDAKKEAKTHAQEAPQTYRQEEQAQLSQAQGEAGASAREQTQGMHDSRAQLLNQISGQQEQTKSKDEKAREKVGAEIQKIYERTKTKVEKSLNELDGKVTAVFDTGAAAAKRAFEDYVKAKMDAYKERRYGGWFGWARWAKDKIAGMPSEVNAFYRQGRDLFLKKMDAVIDTVVSIIERGLSEAKAEIAKGKKEIQDYVSGLPKDLQDVGQQAAQEIQGKFSALEQSVDSKQGELINTLAQKYQENLQAVDARIEQMKEANKGLVQKAVDAVKGVIETIKKLKNMLMNVLSRVAGVIGKIIKDPIGFLGNLVKGVKQGFDNFVSNIGTHLKKGLLTWLTGTMSKAGIQLPETFDLKGIFSLVAQLLGLTWANIRARAVKLLGEQVVNALEKGFAIFKILATEGLAGLWEFVKGMIGDLKAMVMDQIKELVITEVIKAGIKWLIGMLNPAGAFIKACKAIYDIIMFFVNNASQIMSLINAIIDSMAAIASGAISGAAKMVENALAKAIPVVIGFLASLLGLGDLPQKVRKIIKLVQAPINKAIDWVLKKAKAAAKKVSQTFSKKEKHGGKTSEGKGKLLSPAEAVKEIQARMNKKGSVLVGKDNVQIGSIMSAIYAQEKKWVEENVKPTKGGKKPKLLLIPKESGESWWIDVKINPEASTKKWPKAQAKGIGGIGKINNKENVGMFHGGNHKFESAQEIDTSKLEGKVGKGKGLELGSGLYLSHYFRDVRAYPFRKKIHGKDGWIHKFWVPKWILSLAQKAKPNTGGDKEWEGKGDVIKGEWKHIDQKSWKAGYQWVLKNKEGHIAHLNLEDALPPYEAADKWGRGRQKEYPEDFGGGMEGIEEGRKLASAGYRHNKLERPDPQIKGVGDDKDNP